MRLFQTTISLSGFFSSRQSRYHDLIKFVAVVALLAWLLARGTERLGYNWQWYRVPRYLFTYQDGHFTAGPLLEGLRVTLAITGASLLPALALGLATALLRLSPLRAARALARVYLEIIRNTPLLIQLFFMYFVISAVFGIGRFTSAVLALSLFEGAYISEIFRAGILSVPRGQVEAARSLGLNSRQTLILVVLPQAIRHLLPPLASQCVSLVKDSALVSTVALYDLTMQGQMVIAETFLTFEIWFTVAALYWVITLSLSGVARSLERRFRRSF